MVFSCQKISLILGLSVIGAFFLIPRKSELVSRVLKDGDHSRAIEMIGEAPNSETVHKMAVSFSTTGDSSLVERINFILSMIDEPDKVLEVLRGNSTHFDDSQKRQFGKSLSNRCFELNKPGSAMATYEWLSHELVLTKGELRRAVVSARFAGHPEAGIAFVEDTLARRQMTYEDLPGDLRHLVVTMSRELNQGLEALEFLKKELKLVQNSGSEWEILDQLATVSVESDKVTESLPILEEHLAKTEVAQLSFSELVARSAGHGSDENFLKFGKIIAQNLEWGIETERAFFYYQKLAFLGDQYSLERCFSLFGWLQGYEAMSLLLQHIPLESLNIDQLMAYAELEGDAANYKKAESLFSAALARPDVDPGSAYYNKGVVILEQGRYEDCIDDFTKAIEADSANSPLWEKIASIHLTMGQYQEALAAFRNLPFQEHSKEGLDEYRLLAATLGSDRDLIPLAWFMVDEGKHPVPSNFLELAENLVRMGAEKEALRVIVRGTEEFPDSKNLQLARIDQLIQLRDFAGAFHELKRSFDQGDNRFHQRAFRLASDLENPQSVFEILALKDPYAKEWNSSLRIELAHFYEQLDRLEDALAVCQSCEGGEVPSIRLKAKLAYRQRDYQNAALFQEEYVATMKTGKSEAWQFLGDIYQLINRKSDSRNAYFTALRTIQDDLSVRLNDSPVSYKLPTHRNAKNSPN